VHHRSLPFALATVRTPVRILIGIDTFGLIGGSERYALAVSHELAQRGHAVGVLCGARGDEAPKGIELLHVPAYSDESAEAVELLELERAIRGFAPDVIFLLSSRSRAATKRITRLARSTPLVRYIQDHVLFCPGLNKMQRDGSVCTSPLGWVCVDRYALRGGCTCFHREMGLSHAEALRILLDKRADVALARRASSLAVASRYMQRELIQVGIAPERAALVPYFTQSATQVAPESAPDPATLEFLARGEQPLVFTPARLTLPDKGVDYLITALGQLREPFRCVLAGSGPAEAWLREKVRAEGLSERVHFAGWQGASAMEWLYRRAAVVAFPSIWDEPFGLVGIEAMAHGKPVVAFEVGGVPDWLDAGQTGFLAPRRDATAFAAALDRLLAEPELAARFGRAGREKVLREYSPQRHVEALEALFERLRRDVRAS